MPTFLIISRHPLENCPLRNPRTLNLVQNLLHQSQTNAYRRSIFQNKIWLWFFFMKLHMIFDCLIHLSQSSCYQDFLPAFRTFNQSLFDPTTKWTHNLRIYLSWFFTIFFKDTCRRDSLLLSTQHPNFNSDVLTLT